jgi:class 3 adenylate cyclase
MTSKILIVDDEPQIIQHIRILLKEESYSVGFITHPNLLFERLESDSIHLILLDINMPNIDGLTLLSQLKKHPSFQTIPVIMLTGEEDENTLAKCFELGAVDYITKPIREVILKARVTSALSMQTYIKEIEKARNELETRVQERTQELRKTNEAFRLFVPNQFLEQVLDQQSVRSGWFKEQTLSIMFGDIRGFTTLAENMTSRNTFEWLNAFYKDITPYLSINRGFIDKFIGDEIMALFDQPQSADDAVQAAIDIQHSIQRFNENFPTSLPSVIQFGIGINTGEVTLGALGSSDRLNSTVIGDQVNLASRIQGLTKRFNAKILISQYTYGMIINDYCIREVDTMRVRGRQKPVQIYEIFDTDHPSIKDLKNQTKPILLKGLIYYKAKEFNEAMKFFRECLNIFPSDALVLEYIRRTHFFLKYPPPDLWNGVADMDCLI